MGRRYEPMEEGDGYDDYQRYQPAKAKKSGDLGVARYQVSRPSLKSLQSSRKAKFLFVYTNSLFIDKPVRVAFSRKKFPHMECVFEEIKRMFNDKLKVLALFKWPTGELVNDVGEIEEEEDTNLYVCTSGKALNTKPPYGGIQFGGSGGGNSAFLEKYSRNSYDSRRSEKPSPTLRSQGSHGAMRGGQITINIISNTNEKSRYPSLFLDPRSNQPFEELLKLIPGLVEMENPPCKALFSVVKPYKKVESISTLKRVIAQYGDTFWACGREGDPLVKLQGTPDYSPTRNVRQRRNGTKQQQQQQQNGHRDRDDRMRQSNGHSLQSDSQYEEEEDGDDEIEDYHRDVSPQRNNNKRNSKQMDTKKSQNRQSKRFEDENDENDDRRDTRKQQRGAPNKGRRDEEDSPRKDDSRDKQRSDSEERNGRDNQSPERRRRGSTPSPSRQDDRQRGDGDADARSYDGPSEEEMQKSIDAMERPASDLDKDIDY